MKVLPHFRWLALLTLGLALVGPSLTAQEWSLNYSLTSSTNPVPVNSLLTYTLSLTNDSTGQSPNLIFTNIAPASAPIQDAQPSGLVIHNDGQRVAFTVPRIGVNEFQQFTVTVRPNTLGLITNSITISDTSGFTNFVSTNIVNLVTNTPNEADLAVSIVGPPSDVLVGDYFPLSVLITNRGPSSASGVVLTNTRPVSLSIFSLSHSSSVLFESNSTVTFIVTVGTLTNRAFQKINFTLIPTNAGSLTFSSAVGGSDVVDPVGNNDSASTNVLVQDFLPTPLVATNLDVTQTFEPQTGLMEQRVRLVNVGTNSVDSARVIVTGLTTTKRLFNAAGTNSGSPFVIYGTALAAGASIDLLMEYLVPSGAPFFMSNTQLVAVAVPQANLSAAGVTGSPVNLTRTNVFLPPSGNFLIEFPSALGRSYTVTYSDNAAFSNALVALPSYTAPANRVQWVDYGPPKTVSHPSNSIMRFYRVYLNP